jgi:hypothetical protein
MILQIDRTDRFEGIPDAVIQGTRWCGIEIESLDAKTAPHDQAKHEPSANARSTANGPAPRALHPASEQRCGRRSREPTQC